MKVVFCTPSYEQPTSPYLAALKASIPLVKAAGWEEGLSQQIGSPYISNARGTMTRKALDAGADVIVYIDNDISWEPDALVNLISTDDEVVAGTYRFKQDEEKYMGTLLGNDSPIVRFDGLIRADWVPAGFLKITRGGIRRFMKAYPELLYGSPENYHVDLFNHGAYKGVWYGEDYAFSRRFNEAGGAIWIMPDLTITHHNTNKSFTGNFHQFMMRQPGGSKHEITY